VGGIVIRLVDGVGGSMLVSVPKLPYVFHVARLKGSPLAGPPPAVFTIEFMATGEIDSSGYTVYRQTGYSYAPSLRPMLHDARAR
jgi:hypothetical protein